MIDLKPCPFCGEEAAIISSGALTNKHPSFYIKCSSCEIRTLSYVDTDYDLKALEQAVEAWNRRAR